MSPQLGAPRALYQLVEMRVGISIQERFEAAQNTLSVPASLHRHERLLVLVRHDRHVAPFAIQGLQKASGHEALRSLQDGIGPFEPVPELLFLPAADCGHVYDVDKHVSSSGRHVST